MLIKTVTQNGSAIAMPPEECLHSAVVYGLKSQDMTDWVHWVMAKSVQKESFNFTKKTEGEWTAEASGKAMIGKTFVKTGDFHVAKQYSFKVRYESSKDNLGLPDIKVTFFSFDLVDTNPANNVGDVPKDIPLEAPAPAVGGEITPGQFSSKPKNQISGQSKKIK